MCSLPSHHSRDLQSNNSLIRKTVLTCSAAVPQTGLRTVMVKKIFFNNAHSNASLKRSGDYDTLREVMNSSCAQKFQSVTQEPFRKKPETGNSAHDKHAGGAKASVPLPKSPFANHLEAAGGPFEKKQLRHLMVTHKAVPEKRFFLNERNSCL